MSDKLFIDSNIFLYTLDNHDAKRRDKARSILLEASDRHSIYVSTQVLNEVYSVATRKLNVDPVSVKEFLRGLYNFNVIIITKEIIESAIDCSILGRFNYWDALMIAAAEAGQCDTLWSEDMDSGTSVRGITIINPL